MHPAPYVSIMYIHWVTEKARQFQKNPCFTDYTKAVNYVDHNKLENPQRSPYLSPEKPTCGSRMGHEQWTGSKLGREYVKAVYCHPAYLTYMPSTAHKMPG